MALRIVYRKRALRNIESIHRIITEDRPRAADGVILRIRERVKDLLQFPLQGREGLRENRELIITGTPYVVTYRIRGEEIQILMVRHGARRPLG